MPVSDAEKAHENAVANGQHFYTDPRTNLMVMTELYLLERGYCCKSGCRHCPYPKSNPTE